MLNKIWHIHTVEYYLANERNILARAALGLNLEHIMLN